MTRAWEAEGKSVSSGLRLRMKFQLRCVLAVGPEQGTVPAGTQVCPQASPIAPRYSGAQWVVAIILTTVMEQIFKQKILMILKILFLIGPPLSRFAFSVVGIKCNIMGHKMGI